MSLKASTETTANSLDYMDLMASTKASVHGAITYCIWSLLRLIVLLTFKSIWLVLRQVVPYPMELKAIPYEFLLIPTRKGTHLTYSYCYR